MPWEPLRIGAGGFLPSIEVLADPNHPTDPTYRAICARCDTYGGYIGNGIDPWRQVLASNTIPAQYLATYWLGTQAAPAQDDPPFSEGIYDIRLAKSNPDIGFCFFGHGDYGQGGHVWRTSNRGRLWQMVSSFSVGDFTSNYGGWSWQGAGQYRIGIDPANPTSLGAGTGTVYAGVLTGLWYSRNAYDPTPGNVSWANLSPGQIATPDGGGVTGVVFDSGAAPPTDGRTSWVYACSSGTGVYRSTDGGTTWTLLTGGPTRVMGAYVDPDGTYWAISSSAMDRLYKRGRNDSSWTIIVSGGAEGLQGSNFQGLAIHPTIAGRVAIVHDGHIEFTFDGGVSWDRYGPSSMARDTTGDIPWLGTTPHGNFMVGSAFWDPIETKIWISDGIGLWWTDAPTSVGDITTVTWHSKNIGIEQMVATCIVVPWTNTPPASDNVYAAVWDRNVFRVPRSNQGYTADHASHVAGSSVEISSAYGVDYSRENPNHLAYLSNYPLDLAGGYTLDGGDHWTIFPVQPNYNGQTGAGGDIAVPSIDSIIAILGQDGTYPSIAVRSTDRGETWIPLNTHGLPEHIEGSYYPNADGTRRLAIDGAYNGSTNQIVYCYAPTASDAPGLYRSTNKGADWSRIDLQTFASDGYAIQLKSVPGQRGALFMSTGFIGSPGSRHPWSGSAMYYTLGAADDPDTISWRALTGFGSDWPEGDGEVFTYAFGAPENEEQTFPTIYVMGYHGFEFGIWRSTDFDPVNNTATWQKLDNFGRMFYDGDGNLGNSGNLDGPIAMAASMSVYGELYVGYTGSSFAKYTEAQSEQYTFNIHGTAWQDDVSSPESILHLIIEGEEQGGILSVVLSAVTLNATGKVLTEGTASLQLSNVTLAATGVGIEGRIGYLNTILAGVVVAGAGDVVARGSLASTLASVLLTGTGRVAARGALAVTLANETLAGTGKALARGTLASTLVNVTLAGAGTLETISLGTLAVTLANATVTASGKIATHGTLSSTLVSITVAGAGVNRIRGSLNTTLVSLTLAASGTLEEGGIGYLYTTLAGITVASTGKVDVKGSTDLTLANAILSAQGDVEIIGSLNALFNPITMFGYGIGPGIHCNLHTTLDAFTLLALAVQRDVPANIVRAMLLAERLLSRCGRPIDLIVYSDESIDPINPWRTLTEGEFIQSTVGVFIKSKQMMNQEIQIGDKFIIISALNLVNAPNLKGEIRVDQERWKIVKIWPVSPSGIDILYTAQVRR